MSEHSWGSYKGFEILANSGQDPLSGQSHFIVAYALGQRFVLLSLSLCLCMSFTENTNINSPGDQFDYLKWGRQSCTRLLVDVVPWLTSFFNRAGLQQSQLLGFDGGAPPFQPHVERSIFLFSSRESCTLPCLELHRILSVLLHKHTQPMRIHMSFTYCMFCEVCELWPHSSLQEIVGHKLGPLLYYCQRSQQDRIWLPALCSVSEYFSLD